MIVRVTVVGNAIQTYEKSNYKKPMFNECRALPCYHARYADGTDSGMCHLINSATYYGRCLAASSDPEGFSGEIVTRNDYCFVSFYYSFY